MSLSFPLSLPLSPQSFLCLSVCSSICSSICLSLCLPVCLRESFSGHSQRQQRRRCGLSGICHSCLALNAVAASTHTHHGTHCTLASSIYFLLFSIYSYIGSICLHIICFAAFRLFSIVVFSVSDSFSCLVDNHKLRVDLSSDLSLCLIRFTARQLNLYLLCKSSWNLHTANVGRRRRCLELRILKCQTREMRSDSLRNTL